MPPRTAVQGLSPTLHRPPREPRRLVTIPFSAVSVFFSTLCFNCRIGRGTTQVGCGRLDHVLLPSLRFHPICSCIGIRLLQTLSQRHKMEHLSRQRRRWRTFRQKTTPKRARRKHHVKNEQPDSSGGAGGRSEERCVSANRDAQSPEEATYEAPEPLRDHSRICLQCQIVEHARRRRPQKKMHIACAAAAVRAGAEKEDVKGGPSNPMDVLSVWSCFQVCTKDDHTPATAPLSAWQRRRHVTMFIKFVR